MNKENTPQESLRQEDILQKVLIGVPPDLLCNLEEVQRVLKIADEPWAAMVRAGLPVLLTAGRASIGFTTEIIEWARAKPKLPAMASMLRKKRQRRKAK